MKLYWLSFCDSGLPEGQQFLGVSIVEADSDGDAVRIAWDRNCNPGGEVMLLEFPDELALVVPEESKHRLLSREEAEALDEMLGPTVH
jgi:hypothetical protein